MVGSTHHKLFWKNTELSFSCISYRIIFYHFHFLGILYHHKLFYEKIQHFHFHVFSTTTNYFGIFQSFHFSVFSYHCHLLCILCTTHPLLLLWKNGKQFLLVDLKILKNGFFWKIFSCVWRFMGSGLELFLFLVFVVEGFIVFRSFFDN